MNRTPKLIPKKLKGNLQDGGYILEGYIEGDTDGVEYADNWRVLGKSGADFYDLDWRQVFNGHILNDPDAFDFGRAHSRVEIVGATAEQFLKGERLQDIGFVSIAGASNHSKHQLQSMTFGDIVDHIVKYHCNLIYDASTMPDGIITETDIDTSSTGVLRYNVYESNDMWRTIQDIGKAEFYQAWFSRRNKFYYQPQPAFWGTPPTSAGTITKDHLRGRVKVQNNNAQPRDRIGQIQLTAQGDYGTVYTASYPAARERGKVKRIDNIFANDQARANTLAERAYDWETRNYTLIIDVDPALVLYGDDGLGIDLSDKVTLTYDGPTEDSRSGAGVHLNFNEQDFFVYEIEIEFNHEGHAAQASVKLEQDPT